MKNQTMNSARNQITIRRNSGLRIIGAAILLSMIAANMSCKKTEMAATTSSSQEFIDLKEPQNNNVSKTILVADVADYSPLNVDPNLVNAWGLAFSDEGEAWVSAADKGVATIYDGNGVQLDPPVNIPFEGDPNGGAPTGAMYNATESSFFITAANEKSEFIYATENGTIVAAASGNAYTVADRSSFDAVYKGLAIAKNGNSFFLYATDFHNGRIDVWNDQFALQNNFAFTDADIPAGFAPFNIREIDGRLYVTYAKQLGPDNEDDEAGPGNGFVDIYNTDGTFAKRFATQGTLNSPWGIEKIGGATPAILIGNFGSGKISVFGTDGTFMTYLKSGGLPIEIEGLWSIVLPRTNLPPNERKRLYFTAGPAEESHGLFGYLTTKD